jgi:hypothetical protein
MALPVMCSTPTAAVVVILVCAPDLNLQASWCGISPVAVLGVIFMLVIVLFVVFVGTSLSTDGRVDGNRGSVGR